MIHGIGTDIVLIERVVGLLERNGERFARRVLGPDELAEYLRRSSRGDHGPAYAARYLAKRFTRRRFDLDVGRPARGCMVCEGATWVWGESPAQAVERLRAREVSV
jgi:hypothetical protein